MTFNKMLKISNMIALATLVLLAGIYQAKADDTTECKLNDDNECIIETDVLETETVKEKTPEKFKDSKIKRTTKDGKVVEFDGDNYKIVPRTQKRYKKKTKRTVVKPVVLNVEQKRHHNLSLMVGYAPDQDISRRTITPNRDVELRHESNLHLGLSYDYLDLIEITDDVDLSIGGQIMTNESFFGRLGVSW